ncbi:MAG: hypothetical protein GEV06_13430 [Luteitalea sp.]|nr:hypothetical protein [Luteitalea sp.]
MHEALCRVAADMSPRVEALAPGLVTADVSGLRRMFGEAHAIARAAECLAADRGLSAINVAVAGTWMVAALLVRTRRGLTVVSPGEEASCLADLPVAQLADMPAIQKQGLDSPEPIRAKGRRGRGPAGGAHRHYRMAPSPNLHEDADMPCAEIVATLQRWGIRTCADLTRLPADALHARLGLDGLALQMVARGEDPRPLMATRLPEIFEETCELEWPVEEIEPLSFVLARVLEPLCQRLERRDRGVAVLRLRLKLVTRTWHERAIELPAPLRDPRTLRTLLLLDLEAHPPDAGIDRVTVAADVVLGRIVQYTLLGSHPLPAPERLTTLIARLKALAGEGRVGAPRLLDAHRPDAFTMTGFEPPVEQAVTLPKARLQLCRKESASLADKTAEDSCSTSPPLRRLRRPWPIRVRVVEGRPVSVQLGTSTPGGGLVRKAAGPWRTSGAWWNDASRGTGSTRAWDRDEWDVALADGVYRIFQDRSTGGWFLEGELD